MTRSQRVYAYGYCELSVGISAVYQPEERDTNTAAGYEDHDIEQVYFVINTPTGHKQSDLMKGVNMSSPDIQKFLSNLLEHMDLDAWATEADSELE